jgi:hypothetical protein
MGIIDDALKDVPDLGKPDVAEWNPDATSVNSGTDTVAGQLNTLLDSNSPYITQARNRSQVQANSRGLINSSIAAGAGEEAAIGAALPIASQDADTYNRTRLANYDVSTRAGEFNTNSTNQANRDAFNANAGLVGQALGAAYTSRENTISRDWQSGENAADRSARMAELIKAQDFTAVQAEIDRAWKSGEMTLDRANQLKLLIEQQDFTALQNELNRTFTAAESERNRIWQGAENAADRTARMAELIKNQDFSALQAEIERSWRSGEMSADRKAQMDQLLSSQNFTALQNELGRTFTAAESERQRDWQAAQDAAGRAWQEEMQSSQNQFTLTQTQMQQAWQSAQNETARAWQTIQNQLDRDQQLALQGAQSTLTGRNAVTAASMNYQQQAATILADPNMDQTAKNAQLAKLAELYKQTLTAIGSMYSIKVDDIYPAGATVPNDTVSNPNPVSAPVDGNAAPAGPPKTSTPQPDGTFLGTDGTIYDEEGNTIGTDGGYTSNDWLTGGGGA